MVYNWQQPDWKKFTFNLDEVESNLIEFTRKIGKIEGMLKVLPKKTHLDITISSMVAEALKTSEIEGEYFSRTDVVSSIKNNLGLNPELEKVNDLRAIGISELMLDISKSYSEPLSIEKLFSWHKMLMKGNRRINSGAWRSQEESMQVISGAFGREKIHFEAPPSSQVPEEMDSFVLWFNDTSPKGKNPIPNASVRSAIAHLYFESIHPFEDGNGRIGRAISEKVISQTAGFPIPLSLSMSINANKKEYYKGLEKAQKSNHITDWIVYFISITLDAQKNLEDLIEFTLKKAEFFEKNKFQMNKRQLKIIKRMLEEGKDGFQGGINARKYVSMTKTSKATATRDLLDLREKKILKVRGEGRSTSYQVNI